MSTKRDRKKAKRESQREFMAAEAALVLALRGALSIVARSPFRGASASGLLARLVQRAIRLAQKRTRKASASTLQRELAVALDGEVKLAKALVAGDGARALSLAKKIAKRWTGKVAELTADGLPHRRAAKAAATETFPYVEMIARTESATVFNAERQDVLRKSVEFIRRARGELILFKEWDAEMDRRTCSVCERMHGTVREVGESFDTPMPAHPRCRCMVTVVLMPASFAYDNMEDEAA